ncbi:Small-conductance mechanosensitive channel [hydrothermal vent metagenome]|uniref:Small-conductance mechanosensitive channel n=1 Tax=hydrothermal vent metagenome TaxID=652676 RepID=A0A1W1EE60_9ZZZZ
MKKQFKLLIMVLTIVLSVSQVYAAEETGKVHSVTTENVNIPLDQFTLKLGAMTADELFVEADAWLKLLQADAAKVYDKKIDVKIENEKILKLKEQNATDSNIEKDNKIKDNFLIELNDLRSIRKDKEDKLSAILTEINERIGLDEKGLEKEEVKPYRRYLKSVSGISDEITDPETFIKSATAWMFSKDGGKLWLINFLEFMAILFFAYLISKILSNGVNKAFEMSNNKSQLLKDFIVNIVSKMVMLIGVLMGLSILGVNMGPVLAFVGAAGFVVAFALQNTLSNFASGLMLMLYRPFDIDDVVDVAGVIGTVKSMTLVTTSVMTADNRLMIIPNNTIWGNIITNVTHSDKRRVDLTVGIGYNESIEKAQKVLEDILSNHPLILKDPEPAVKVHELADSSVNFIVRPWTLTADYWTVYWEITRRIKVRFDEENISIPFPQRDIHIISSVDAEPQNQKKRAFTKKKAEQVDVNEMESGDEDNN